MKNTLYKISFISFILFIGLYSCKKETNDSLIETETPVVNGETIITSIGGEVIDENGLAVFGAKVTIGSSSMQTNSNGLFLFRNISVNENKAYIKVEKNGFFLGSRNLVTRKNTVSNVKIKLLSNSTVATFSSTTGGIVTHNGVSINFPANAIKFESGGIYSGTVNVALKYLDPNSDDIGQTMPGDLRALNSSDELRLLQTYGMIAVELTSASGQKLNLNDGKKAEISIPLSGAYLADAPSTIPLWYFDEVNGIWKEEGSANKVGNNFVGEVSHFSFWNCDRPGPSTTISGSVTCGSNSVAGAIVKVYTTSGRLLGMTRTANNGSFNGLIPMNVSLVMKIYSPNNCAINPDYNSPIGSHSSPLILAPINSCSSSLTTSTLSGKLIDCSGNAISNGALQIDISGTKLFFFPDAFGNISAVFNHCSASTISITGLDFSNLISSSAVTHNVGPTINIGNFSVCGHNLNDFIQYSLDGFNYTLTAASYDSLFIQYSNAASPHYTYVDCYSNSGSVYKRFTGFIQGTTVGTHTMSNVSVNGLNSTSSTMITSITEYGAVGSFIKGSFTGTFIDNFTISHTLYGSFSLKRKY